jgi:predicted AlkP superfamily pyrophosphatase or phosphodiesterase
MNQMSPLVVINIVGITPSMLGEHSPNLNALIKDGFMCPMSEVFPAVTCTAQASMLTGLMPNQHGIVANGWYFKDLAEVWFWRQSNQLVQGQKVWEELKARSEDFTCAKLFWWYNMYSSADYSVTPRPIYPADGRKIPGIYSQPQFLQTELEARLGPFPMFHFWGPAADIRSSQWIAQSAQHVFDVYQPNLSFVYLPHLDYNLQRLGPDHPDITEDIKAIDQVAGKLIDAVRAKGADVMVVSEYGIEPATGVVNVNQILREQNYIAVRETLGWEMLDYGASRAFAVADHQVAHIYVNDKSALKQVVALFEKTQGIEHVLYGENKAKWGLDHPRSGDIVLVAEQNHWFTYYYWLDETKAPDFARTVDIHRKPGYDPVELFIDPGIPIPKLKIALRILQSKLNFRTLMDVIPLNPMLVRGTHGRLTTEMGKGPLLICSNKSLAREKCKITDVRNVIISHYGN